MPQAACSHENFSGSCTKNNNNKSFIAHIPFFYERKHYEIQGQTLLNMADMLHWNARIATNILPSF